LTLISLEKDITKSVETHINGLSAHLYDWTVSADPQMEVLTGLHWLQTTLKLLHKKASFGAFLSI